MIKTKELCKQYGKKLVFKNVDINLPSQGLIILSGPSGSGKTSLLNILTGFDNKYSGSIQVDGIELNTLKDKSLQEYHRQKIGFIYQDFNILPELNVYENIRLSANHSEEDISDVMKSLGIYDLRDQKGKTCSGGEKQRIAIARTLVSSPSIILADEPTGSLDKKNSDVIMEILKEISKTRLVIVSSHNPKHTQIANEVLYFKDETIQHDICNRNNDMVNINSVQPFGNLEWLRPVLKRIQFKKTITIAILLAISSILTLVAFNTNIIFQKEISNFVDKNHHYKTLNAPYSDELNELLNDDDRIEEHFIQYKIDSMSIKWQDKEILLEEKYPVSISRQYLSFGQMPKPDKNEIALSPSLAAKLNKQTNKLIGETIFLDDIELIVSGIFNLSYDDYILSSSVEKDIINNLEKQAPISITLSVNNIENLESVVKDYEHFNLDSAVDEVSSFLSTFRNIENTFKLISIIIFLLILYLVFTIISKTQNLRSKEYGLLRSLGYSNEDIRQYMSYDIKNIIKYYWVISTLTTCIGAIILYLVLNTLLFSLLSFAFMTFMLSIYLIIVYTYVNGKILKLEPSIALK